MASKLHPELIDRQWRVPMWYRRAKLGIFIHWVPASVPGFAPTGRDIRQLLSSKPPDPISELPYSEWYQNSLRFPGSSVSRFHRENFGQRPYEEFAGDFVAGLDQWDPQEWADRIARTGAGYVVMVTKHHDGWCLWPSSVPNPQRSGWCSERDLVGELATAVRARGLRFGVYYSGGYDWTFNDHPIGTIADGLMATPRGEYIDYAEEQLRELIERYRPSVLWNDIGWPSSQRRLEQLFAHYFRMVPDGVVNDRWTTGADLSRLLSLGPVRSAVNRAGRAVVAKRGIVGPKPPFFNFRTPEFTPAERVDRRPWEMTRGMDWGFGYNAASSESDYLSRSELMHTFFGTVAHGGNLLLNLGPRGADAQIPEEQLRRLEWLGAAWDAAGPAVLGADPCSTLATTEVDDSRTYRWLNDGDLWAATVDTAGAVVMRRQPNFNS